MDYCVYVVSTELEAKTPLAKGPEYSANCGGKPSEQPSIEGEELLRLPSPGVNISDMAPYYVDAESYLLLCEMTTMFLKLNNYNQETPFFCSKIGQICKDCGNEDGLFIITDSITMENARGVAEYLNGIVGRAAEAKWHGAECFGGILLYKTEDEKTKTLLRECKEFCFDTHDICYRIWEQMGLGPHTLFRFPAVSAR